MSTRPPGGNAHRPRKRFGQNFLHEPAAIERCVRALNLRSSDRTVEIGPGQGALTRPLLAALPELHVIEIDRDLCEVLRQAPTGSARLIIHEADALEFDFSTLASTGRLRVVGNLPYNISTPLIFHLLGQREHVQDMHFMLQREVVQRMAAAPGSKAYGRLSVMTQIDCMVETLFVVGPGAFKPAPKVESAFVRLVVRNQPIAEIADRSAFAALTTRLFSQRRKTLRSTLKANLTADAIEALGIDPTSRPEQLSIQALAKLANRAYPTNASD